MTYLLHTKCSQTFRAQLHAVGGPRPVAQRRHRRQLDLRRPLRPPLRREGRTEGRPARLHTQLIRFFFDIVVFQHLSYTRHPAQFIIDTPIF